MQVQIRHAAPTDLDAVEQLLTVAELPLAGLRPRFPEAYVVACHDGEVVGVAGLELHGDVGLLRSVAVAPALRSQGFGWLLVANRMGRASRAKLAAVYLLTTTAKDYFARFDFIATDRANVPARLAASEEFAHACPASAACLVWRPRQ